MMRDEPSAANRAPGRRLRLIHRPLVIDVTKYVTRPRMSGIPRVIHALITADAAHSWTFAVWDRGAFGPIDIDASGAVTFPAAHWRRPVRPPLPARINAALRSSRLGRGLLVGLQLIGAARLLGPFLRWVLRRRWGRTRARVTLALDGARLFIPAIPDRQDTERLLTDISGGTGPEVEVFVHDLLPITHPQYFDDDAVLAHVSLLSLLAVATRIVTSTGILRSQIEASLLALTGTSPPITVAELPVSLDPSTSVRAERGLRTDGVGRLLFVGGFEHRKGLSRLLDALEDADGVDAHIAVVGEANPLRGSEVAVARRAASNHHIVLVGQVPDERLVELLADAEAVLYLSHAEGYGLPVLEALDAGRPVICADTPVNRMFADRYGGIVRVPAGADGIDVRGLRRTLERADWRDDAITSATGRSVIPRDRNTWAADVLSMGT